MRETAREAEADLPAVLRLIDAGKVRVTDKKRVPTEASRTAVAGVLTGGDFYTAADQHEYDGDPAGDLAIKAFAWPMLVQAAGLAEKRGDALKLTPADPLVELDAPLAKAFDAHGWDTFRNVLVALIEGTTAATVGRNLRFVDRLCSAGARPKDERLAVCRLLAEKAVGAIDRIDRQDIASDWRLRDVNHTEVLTALPRALVAAEQLEPLSQFLTRAQADPKTYPLPEHIAALTTIGPWLKKHLKMPCEPVARWLAACCGQLEALTVAEPVAPTDFRRDASVRCDCVDCKELKAFLKGSAERVHRFRMRRDRRQHLEQQIERHECDAACTTDRTGSPQTLVCTKTTASFDARLKKYRDDWAHLAALRSLQGSLPT